VTAKLTDGTKRMFMYLNFLQALLAVISVIFGKKRIGYALWLALLVVAITSFQHHATDALNLSF
jgi:hypothetical protein